MIGKDPLSRFPSAIKLPVEWTDLKKYKTPSDQVKANVHMKMMAVYWNDFARRLPAVAEDREGEDGSTRR